MNICVVGINSYIGNSFITFNFNNSKYTCTVSESRDNQWKSISFQNTDVILHVAGIAHISTNSKLKNLYYSVNRDLPVAVAQKAKSEGVAQFIFMSSIIVYGNERHITSETKPKPTNMYGESKLQAEESLLALADEKFTVTIIRTPMVYGQNCKGNFPLLINLAKITPIFPNIDNARSMIYIDNLCAFLDLCIDKHIAGIVYPQNTEYVCTKDIIEQVAHYFGKKIWYVNFFNPFIRLLRGHIDLLEKVFGNKTYDKNLSQDIPVYNLYDFKKSINRYLELTEIETPSDL